ncbi:MAG: tetratricopeptide repeat protein [Tannerellaceae bacterium]
MVTRFKMKKILFIIIIQIFSFSVFAENEIDLANEAYSKGNYIEAIDLYNQVLEQKGESAEVYFNLGNAYYKENKTANAILYYERALLLDPSDADIRFNLELAKQKSVDKIVPVGEFFISSWARALKLSANSEVWSLIGVVCYILLLICAAIFLFNNKIILRKISFYSAILLIVIVIVANVFAADQTDKLQNRSAAIVFAPTVTVKSSPDNSGNDLFLLHEGTKVVVKSQLGSWYEIQLEDGNIGWISKDKVEII